MLNENHEVEEVMNYGVEYWAALIYKVESRGIKVLPVTKSIVNQLELKGSVTPKQAATLMNFKHAFDQ